MSYIAVDIGVKHFAYCVIDKELSSLDQRDNEEIDFNKLLSFGCIELSKNNNDIINDLIEFIENQRFSDQRDEILIIEQQVINNVKAMIIQNILMTICKLKNINYVLFNPKLKFNYIEGEKIKLSYKQRKNKSIDYARIYLNKFHKNMLDIFEKFDKKDDVADAVVMAVMYKLNMDKNKIKDVFKDITSI